MAKRAGLAVVSLNQGTQDIEVQVGIPSPMLPCPDPAPRCLGSGVDIRSVSVDCIATQVGSLRGRLIILRPFGRVPFSALRCTFSQSSPCTASSHPLHHLC